MKKIFLLYNFNLKPASFSLFCSTNIVTLQTKYIYIYIVPFSNFIPRLKDGKKKVH